MCRYPLVITNFINGPFYSHTCKARNARIRLFFKSRIGNRVPTQSVSLHGLELTNAMLEEIDKIRTTIVKPRGINLDQECWEILALGLRRDSVSKDLN